MTDSDSASKAPAAPDAPLPPGVEEYAGEVQAGRGAAPGWLRNLPYGLIVLCLLYYALSRAFDPVNLVFGGLLLFWFIYTPIAQRRGWFFIPM